MVQQPDSQQPRSQKNPWIMRPTRDRGRISLQNRTLILDSQNRNMPKGPHSAPNIVVYGFRVE